jgi:RNA ligase (TIGR02306 family)
MSSLIVEVCKIDDIYPHKNADKMDIAKIKGWEVCVGKGQFNVGDTVVYFPPDCIIPLELSDKLNITKYLSKGRVKATNLRGFCSYGTVMEYDGDKPIGTSMSEELGITKWEAPIKATDGDAAKPDSNFHTYFSMENLRNYPDAFIDGEEIYISEKIHGQNARVGLIQVANDNGQKVWAWAAGSHDVQRKQYITKTDGTKVESVFWKALTPQIKELLIHISQCGYKAEEIDNGPPVKDNINTNVVLFSERFGSSVQDLVYGFSNGNYDFRYFDIAINGSYVPSKRKYELFEEFGIKTVPVLYHGPFSMNLALEHANGNTILTDESQVKEGIVIVSALEKPCITDKRVFSRTQFKLINPDYLTRKNGTEYH